VSAGDIRAAQIATRAAQELLGEEPAPVIDLAARRRRG
jgi:hypothetical protein